MASARVRTPEHPRRGAPAAHRWPTPVPDVDLVVQRGTRPFERRTGQGEGLELVDPARTGLPRKPIPRSSPSWRETAARISPVLGSRDQEVASSARRCRPRPAPASPVRSPGGLHPSVRTRSPPARGTFISKTCTGRARPSGVLRDHELVPGSPTKEVVEVSSTPRRPRFRGPPPDAPGHPPLGMVARRTRSRWTPPWP